MNFDVGMTQDPANFYKASSYNNLIFEITTDFPIYKQVSFMLTYKSSIYTDYPSVDMDLLLKNAAC